MEKLVPYVLIPVWMAVVWWVSGWIGAKVRPRRPLEQANSSPRRKNNLHRRGFFHPNMTTRRFLAWSSPFFAVLAIFLPFAQVYRESVLNGERVGLAVIVIVFFLLVFAGVSLAHKRGDLRWSAEDTEGNTDENE